MKTKLIVCTLLLMGIASFAQEESRPVGNIGIGTNTPRNTLEIQNGIEGRSGLRFTNLTALGPVANANGKVLSVNDSGDVILVEAHMNNNLNMAGLAPNRFVFAANGATLSTDSLLTLADNGTEKYLLIKPAAENVRDVLKMQSPSLHHNALPFTFRYHYSPNADGTANTPMQFGFNTDGVDDPLQPGIGFSIEPRFITGGLHLLELHQNVYLPPSPGHAGGESVRILTPTFTVRDSLGNSENQWDMRGTQFQVKTLTDKLYFAASGNTGGSVMEFRDISSGYGFCFKTNGADSAIYWDGRCANQSIIMRNMSRVIFDGNNPNAPWLGIGHNGVAPGWYNMLFRNQAKIEGIEATLELGTPSYWQAKVFANAATGITGINARPGWNVALQNNGINALLVNPAGNILVADAESEPIDPSAKLEIQSTTKGLLLPRLTTAQRDNIERPAAGLIIFNTSDTKFQGFDGKQWVNLNM